MLTIRKDQLRELGKVRAGSLRLELLEHFRRLGLEAQEQVESGALLVRDKAGGQASITGVPGGVAATSGEGRTHTFHFGDRETLTSITDPEGTEIAFEHNSDRWLSSIHRAHHSNFDFNYDDGRVAAIRFPDNTSARFAYDAKGQLIGLTDRNGRDAKYTYSESGQVTGITDWQGNQTSFGYRGPDVPTTVVLPNGNRYDWVLSESKGWTLLVNGIPHLTLGESSEQQGTFEVSCADGTWARYVINNGRIVQAINDVATLAFEYDHQGNIIKEESNGAVVMYLRNELGALTGIITPDGSKLGFKRDTEQRVTEITDWNGGRIQFTRRANGSLARVIYPNNVAAHFGSSAMGLPESMRLIASPFDMPLAEYRWEDDQCDRVVAMSEDGVRTSYRFDGEGRLLSENGIEFQLDSNGNRIAGPGGASTFDSAGQILSWAGQQFKHDQRGNMISGACPRGRATFTYDGLDRLITASTASGQARYAYDALGRRIRKDVGGRVTRYIWAGEQLLSETTIEKGVTSQHDYLHFPELNLPLAIRVQGKCRYLHTGRRSEVLCMTGPSGELLWQAHYSAFGDMQIRVSKEFQPWRLAGNYYDEESGLSYVLARYYNPQLGRFLTADPRGLSTGNLNLYCYCNGDPINRIDPTGEIVFLAVIAVIVVGAAIGALVGAGIEAYRQHKADPGKPLDWGVIGKEAGKGAIVGAVGSGVGLLLAPVAAAAEGVAVVMAAGAGIGAVTAGVEQCVDNKLHDRPLTEGIGRAMLTGGAVGAVTAGVGAIWANRARKAALALRLELREGGHSLARHGPNVSKQALKRRLQQGIAPDGKFSPTKASTRFKSYDEWMRTREAARHQIAKREGLDLAKAPPPGTDSRFEIRTEHGRPIDDGFIGKAGTKVKVKDSATGKVGLGYTDVEPVDGLTRTKTTIEWNPATQQWETKQHYPTAENWDNNSGKYTKAP
jgi:RHS repeat-associated protein